MLVSAYWHGIHPGYYLSFLTIPPCLLAEDLVLAAFSKNAGVKQQRYVGWFVWFLKGRALDYMAMGFLLLSYEKTISYWSSVYYCVHVWTFVLIVVSYVCLQMKTGKSKQSID